MPRLSVLMPVFNAERMVRRAITTTLRALPADSELVALDDGSADATPRVLASISDSRLRVLTQKNAGVAASLTTLLAETDSQYVARMDADDVCFPWRFGQQQRAIDGGSDVTFSTVVALRNRRPPVPPRPQRISSRAFPFHLLLKNPVAHSTMFAKRSVIEDVGGYRTIPAEDYDLWLRLALAGRRLTRDRVPTIGYRFHPGQVTATDGWRRSSWTDDTLGLVYADLAQRLVGYRELRITTLSVDDSLTPSQKRADFGEFARRFHAAVAPLPAGDRRGLLAKLAERRRWLESRLEKDAP